MAGRRFTIGSATVLAGLMLASPMLVGPAASQTVAPAADSRYTITPTAKGYIRLDSRTGEVSVCTERAGGGMLCQVAADDRQTLQQEIDRLSEENTRLRAALEGKPVPAPAEARRPPDTLDQWFDGARDLTREAYSYAERLWQSWTGSREPSTF
jgi:hypothetical protein